MSQVPPGSGLDGPFYDALRTALLAAGATDLDPGTGDAADGDHRLDATEHDLPGEPWVRVSASAGRRGAWTTRRAGPRHGGDYHGLLVDRLEVRGDAALLAAHQRGRQRNAARA